MNRRVYLGILVVLLALAAIGVYLRTRARTACDTPAPPPPAATPPPKVPGFAIEPACGTGADAPKAPVKPQAK
jgi:hypothetical protein